MDRIEIYRGRGLRKSSRGWRWRYVAAGNYARLASGHESYNSQEDALAGLRRVCGLAAPIAGQDGWLLVPPEKGFGRTWRVSRYEDDSILVAIKL